MNNLISSPHSSLVLSAYVLRVFTGHNNVLAEKGKRKTPKLVYLGVIVLSGWLVKCYSITNCLILVIFSCNKSAVLDGRVIPNRS